MSKRIRNERKHETLQRTQPHLSNLKIWEHDEGNVQGTMGIVHIRKAKVMKAMEVTKWKVRSHQCIVVVPCLPPLHAHTCHSVDGIHKSSSKTKEYENMLAQKMTANR